ncbi:MAG: hypothetical protein OXI25_05735 [Chloroflexota bacterium]|nr:hypothetical protein [Chloroflexota bacterium]
MSDHPMDDLWRELRALLELRVEPKPGEGAGSEMEVRFIVANAAQRSDDAPRVVFEDVELLTDVGGEKQRVQVGALAPGERFEHVAPCAYADLPTASGSVEGRVSADAFLRVRRSARAAGGKMPWAGFVSAVEQMRIDEPVDFMRGLPIPGPDSTFGQVKQIEEGFRERARHARALKARVDELHHLTEAPQPARTLLNEHHRLVAHYLTETASALDQAANALPPQDERQFEATLALLAGRLGRQVGLIRELGKRLSE